MGAPRYKIDAADNRYRPGPPFPFGVFQRKVAPGDVFMKSWCEIAAFETMEEANLYYLKICKLPEYHD